MEWPEKITIGTQKAFKRGEEYHYEKMYISDEDLYVCNRGSQWAREGEKLVLRRQDLENGSTAWIAYDGAVINGVLYCRHAVFRCIDEDITLEGQHVWQTNWNADATIEKEPDWDGTLTCETRQKKKHHHRHHHLHGHHASSS